MFIEEAVLTDSEDLVQAEVEAVDIKLDTSGTRCPVPLIRAKQALKSMTKGQLLEVISTDPSSKADFEAMLSHLPDRLLSHERINNAERFVIEKG